MTPVATDRRMRILFLFLFISILFERLKAGHDIGIGGTSTLRRSTVNDTATVHPGDDRKPLSRTTRRLPRPRKCRASGTEPRPGGPSLGLRSSHCPPPAPPGKRLGIQHAATKMPCQSLKIPKHPSRISSREFFHQKYRLESVFFLITFWHSRSPTFGGNRDF